ncbi:hypothetical protein [Paenibacillus tengchongensis]|uniref:hypothetical protein n=1 Tax=Paenibacillus tengchongensis TaxID=2608684 RepID=UPI00124D8B3E|nr:hypothetical protein [Paenibacillus tengchongensis]
MNQTSKQQPQLLPGELRITGGASGEAALTLQVPRWNAGQRESVLRRLADHPWQLYVLLNGGPGAELDGVPLLPTAEELQAHNPQSAEAELQQPLTLLSEALEEEPLRLFGLRGMDKEELQNGVFALWAEEAQDEAAGADRAAPGGALAQELLRLERKGSAVPTGEWLAEAAAEGSLHQPGAQFHALAARPFPASPEVAVPAEDWGALLPRTPRSGEGLALIMRRTAEAAQRRAAEAAPGAQPAERPGSRG